MIIFKHTCYYDNSIQRNVCNTVVMYYRAFTWRGREREREEFHDKRERDEVCSLGLVMCATHNIINLQDAPDSLSC